MEYEQPADFDQSAPKSNVPLNIDDKNLVSGLNSNVQDSDRVKAKGYEAAELFMNQENKFQASVPTSN